MATSSFYVFKIKSNLYYKSPDIGAWEARKGISLAKISTRDVFEATRFVSPMSGTPYDHDSLTRGKWVEMRLHIEEA